MVRRAVNGSERSCTISVNLHLWPMLIHPPHTVHATHSKQIYSAQSRTKLYPDTLLTCIAFFLFISVGDAMSCLMITFSASIFFCRSSTRFSKFSIVCSTHDEKGQMETLLAPAVP